MLTKTKIITLAHGAKARFVPASVFSKRRPTVLVVHGWGSNNSFDRGGTYPNVQLRLKKAGVNSLLVSLRGFTPSGGDLEKFTRTDHLQDVIDGYEWLEKSKEVDLKCLGAIGVSYGAYLISIGTTRMPDLKSLCFRVPALYPDGDWQKPMAQQIREKAFKEWRKLRHDGSDCLALLRLQSFKGSAAFCFSEKDEDIPITVGMSYMSSLINAKEKYETTILDAEHQLKTPEQKRQFLDFVDSWCKTQL